MHRLIVGSGTPERRWQAWFQAHPPRPLDLTALMDGDVVVHVVAPHPDDEIVGCAGTLRRLARMGATLQVWAVTDGEASHPDSPAWPKDALAAARTRESEQALEVLGIPVTRIRMGLPDGGVTARQVELAERLAQHLSPGDIVIAPWRLDGHPDHEATGRASTVAAFQRGCRMFEVPIWGWHWAEPDNGTFPWGRAAAVVLDDADLQAKRAAIQMFRSQLDPDPSTGKAAILPDFALARLQRTFEVLLR